MLLLPQAVVLPGSDAGSGGVKPASSFAFKTVRPCVPSGARCMGHAIWTCSAVCEWRRTRKLVKERDHICAWTNRIAQRQFAGD